MFSIFIKYNVFSITNYFWVICRLTDFHVNFLYHQVSEQASHERHPILFEVRISSLEFILSCFSIIEYAVTVLRTS